MQKVMEALPPGRVLIRKFAVKSIQNQFTSGLLTQGERYNKVVDIWSRTNDQVANAMMDKLGKERVTDSEGKKQDQEFVG